MRALCTLVLFIVTNEIIATPLKKSKQLEHVHTNCTRPGLFALTFDDGPSAGRTEAILDVLKLNNVTATFFVCGNTYGDLRTLPTQLLLKKIVSEGHEIGIHTWNHKDLPEPWRHYEEVRTEVTSVSDKVYEIMGLNMTVMRPPYGDYNETLVDIVHGELGHEIIMFNIDTTDWDHPGDTEEGIRGYIEGTQNSTVKTHSFIALHHDPLPGGPELAQAAINFMKNLNYKFVTASECVGLVK